MSVRITSAGVGRPKFEKRFDAFELDDGFAVELFRLDQAAVDEIVPLGIANAPKMPNATLRGT